MHMDSCTQPSFMGTGGGFSCAHRAPQCWWKEEGHPEVQLCSARLGKGRCQELLDAPRSCEQQPELCSCHLSHRSIIFTAVGGEKKTQNTNNSKL